MKFCLIISLLISSVFFISCDNKEEKEAQLKSEEAFARARDSAERAYGEARNRSRDSLINAKKKIVEDQVAFNAEYEKRKNSQDQSEISSEPWKKPTALIVNSIHNSVYTAKGSGCEANEKFEMNGDRIELDVNLCPGKSELKYRVTKQSESVDGEKVKDWYMLLAKDLAMLKANSGQAYFQIEKSMAATLRAMSSNTASSVKNIPPVKFENGSIQMNSLETQGKKSMLEFTVVLD